ncbi:tetratricopeptide repeat protein [uncultured Bacteroides sp.]|uniref:tetratricopeptide repeat protein n=1 Tax=uncultured Bacteroides sp. TaxID=162156 RepID=UPI002AA76204|nr:tetratricopeptide repeat protein [uncultured Bacteroides sp.]
MTSANFQQWIEHPDMLNKDTLYELRTLLARYPYFQSLRLLYLKNLYLLHDITFGSELRRATLYVADRRLLFNLIEGDKYLLHSRKKKELLVDALEQEPDLDRTLSLINRFLSSVPEELSQQSDFDYATDYTPYLIIENQVSQPLDEPTENVPRLHGHELIDDFIEMNSSDILSLRMKPLEEKGDLDIELPEIESRADEDDDSCFTETLAKIYIKQQRYSKALEIIEKLNLKYPKKNAYFADQIRFLEKLIINAKSK